MITTALARRASPDFVDFLPRFPEESLTVNSDILTFSRLPNRTRNHLLPTPLNRNKIR
jgi:hypothetical protein